MDARLWRELPEELLPRILSRLPWWSSLRLRGVCKSWNFMLSDPKFLTKCAPIAYNGVPCCVLSVSSRDACVIVNSVVRKWRSLSSLSTLLPGSVVSGYAQIGAATAGLFLIEARCHATVDNFLINPLNQTRRLLPPLPELEDGSANRLNWMAGVKSPLRMMVDGDNRNVKVIAVHFDMEHGAERGLGIGARFFLPSLGSGEPEIWKIYVYDLFEDSWDLVSSNLQSERNQIITDAVLVGRDLYLLTKQPAFTQWGWHRVFKATRNRLLELEVPALHQPVRVPTVRIFQHRGSLMLVRGTNGTSRSVDMWRLNHMEGSWSQVVVMPASLSSMLGTLIDNVFHIDVEGDYICFTLKQQSQHRDVIILLNLVTLLWEIVSCANGIIRPIDEDCDTFLWQPRLDIVL